MGAVRAVRRVKVRAVAAMIYKRQGLIDEMCRSRRYGDGGNFGREAVVETLRYQKAVRLYLIYHLII